MYLSKEYCLTLRITYCLQRHAVSQSWWLAHQLTEGNLALEGEFVTARMGWEVDMQIAWL